ncbi:hypothetical protein B0H34DRAFT_709745 [Crassisporium funariophilum]|nr:hypothetical protein B0H34DRAFT_709745 [Crassisporium funariophilum]
MFSGSHDLLIAGGTFHNHSLHESGEIILKTPSQMHTCRVHSLYIGINKLHGKIAPGAFHDSGERFDPPKCHPNTRLAVLRAIMDWVETAYMTSVILWLYGPAGAGKSAIAQTIAEQCHVLGILAGSFFFSRTTPGRSDSSRFIATLVYQLMAVVPEMRRHVESALDHDPLVLDRSLETQIEILFVKPLAQVFSTGQNGHQAPKARLIIVDGLDECQGQEAQRYILEVICGAIERLSIPLSFLIVSRPEQQIRDFFNLQTISAVTTTLSLDSAFEPDSDIESFLEEKFDEIKATHPYRSQIPNDWPPPTSLQQIVEKSSGQFIYASTIVKYVQSSRHWPMKRLDIVSQRTGYERDIPFIALDNLYRLIFDLVEQPDEVMKVLSFLILERSSTVQKTVEHVETLFSYGSGELYDILMDLHSIVYVPSPDCTWEELYLFHASLGDFLMDRSRSGKFFIDTGEAHAMLTQTFIRHLPIHQTRKSQLHPCQELSFDVFIDHCVLASPTRALFECLFHHNLHHFFELHSYAASMAGPTISDLFSWFKKQNSSLQSNFPEDKSKHDLYMHHLTSWDKMVLDSIALYPTGSCVQLLLTAVTCDAFMDFSDNIHSMIFYGSLFSVESQYHDFYRNGLRFISTSNQMVRDTLKGHQAMLVSFLQDARRAGPYHISGDEYLRLAEKMIDGLEKPTNSDRECWSSYFPFLLSKASYSSAFVSQLHLLTMLSQDLRMFGKQTIPILEAIKAYLSRGLATLSDEILQSS